ncbi:ISL3 family transposase, partial [candidate division KSB1 bacterium]|nr:ISL3 family transposase [candidate division KSB1 bacterium]
MIMSTTQLFASALGLETPWKITDVQFDAGKHRLDIRIDFKRGSKWKCPQCSKDGCPVHDTQERTWRHLNFFEHKAYITARVPRITC